MGSVTWPNSGPDLVLGSLWVFVCIDRVCFLLSFQVGIGVTLYPFLKYLAKPALEYVRETAKMTWNFVLHPILEFCILFGTIQYNISPRQISIPPWEMMLQHISTS